MDDRGDMSADGAYSSTSRATLNAFQFSGSPYTSALDVQYFILDQSTSQAHRGFQHPLEKYVVQLRSRVSEFVSDNSDRMCQGAVLFIYLLL